MIYTALKWTVEEYHRLIEAGFLEGKPVELLAGEIVTMPPEDPIHAGFSSRAADYLRNALRAYPVLIRDAKPITLSTSEPEPDIAIVQYQEDYYTSHHPYPDQVFAVIEYSNSTLEKDLKVKRNVYAAAGISEYWVVNLQEMKLIIFRPGTDAPSPAESPEQGVYGEEIAVNSGTVFLNAFADVPIEVSMLLRRA